MRPSFIRTGVVFTTIATAGAVSLASPAFAVGGPDLEGQALSAAAVADVTGTVPSGVCSGSFSIRGAGGDGLSDGARSFPGLVAGSMTLSAGQSVVLKTGAKANGVAGGLGGFAAGGNGRDDTHLSTLYFGYGGGAASGFLLNGTVIAVGGGGGGAGNGWQGNGSGGAGGGSAGGAGQNGTNLAANTALGGALGNSTSPIGQDALTATRDGNNMPNPVGGAGGGGGWNGGQGGTFGGSGGGGSNYANASAMGITVTSNGSHGAIANGYTSLTYSACPAPSAISAVTVTPNGTSAALSFPAAVDNGTPVTAYQYSLNGGTSWNTLTTSGSSTKTATISSLSLSTAYTVQVRPVYVSADIVANAVANGGPGRAITAYAGTTSQSFTTLAQNVVASTTLAETGRPQRFAPLAGALAALVAGVSLVIARRKYQTD